MDTSLDTDVKKDEKSALDLAQRRKETRLARYLLKGKIDENSVLIPSDKWAREAVWDFAKKSKSLHKNAGLGFASAAGAVATVVAGTIGAVAVASFWPVIAIGAATLGVAALLGKKTHDFFLKLKTETLEELKEDVGLKYLTLKANEIKAAFERKKEELARKKAAEKAAKPAVEAKAEPAPAAPVTTTVTANGITNAPAAPKAEEKPQSIGGSVGGWLLKKALEQAAKKKEVPPAAAAAQDNTPPKTDVKKIDPPKVA